MGGAVGGGIGIDIRLRLRELPGDVELLPGFCGEIDAAAAHSEEIRLLPYRKAHVLLGWCNRCSGVRFVPVYAVG